MPGAAISIACLDQAKAHAKLLGKCARRSQISTRQAWACRAEAVWRYILIAASGPRQITTNAQNRNRVSRCGQMWREQGFTVYKQHQTALPARGIAWPGGGLPCGQQWNSNPVPQLPLTPKAKSFLVTEGLCGAKVRCSNCQGSDFMPRF